MIFSILAKISETFLIFHIFKFFFFTIWFVSAIIKSKPAKLEQKEKKIAKLIGKNFKDILYAW